MLSVKPLDMFMICLVSKFICLISMYHFFVADKQKDTENFYVTSMLLI